MDKVIFTFWTGDNPMTYNRKMAFVYLINNCGVKIKLITPENLSAYIKEPLHPSFDKLHLTHKSDYLRTYFMHFYGGGYSDIKACRGSWFNSFDLLEKSDKWLLGYTELNHGVAPVGGQLEKELKRNYRKLLGNGAYICKPNTEFTLSWYNALLAKMDTFDFSGEYPIKWTEILGNIFHPLCYEYKDHLLHDNSVIPNFTKSYR